MNWFPIILGAVIMFLICLGLHTLDIDRIEAKQVAALASQTQYDIKQCQDSKDITTNSDKNYENKYNSAMLELGRLRQQPTTCVHIIQPASGGNATNKPDKPHQRDGVTSSALYAYAGECETDRIKVITLQDFITKVWTLNKQ